MAAQSLPPELFEILIQHTLDIVTVLSLDGKIIYESPAVERIVGYTPGELEGKRVFDYIHPDDRDRVIREFEQGILKPGEVHTVQFRYKHKNDSWVYLESTASFIADLGKHWMTGVVVSSRDITERKKTEEQLAASENRYRQLVEQSPDATFVCQNFRIVYANPAALRMLHVPNDDQIREHNLTELFIDSQKERIQQMLEQPNARVGTDVQTILRKDGNAVSVSIQVADIEFSGKPSQLVIMRDLSLVIDTQEKLHQSEQDYRSLVDNALVGIYKSHIDGHVLYVNPMLLKFFEFEHVDDFIAAGAAARYKSAEDRKRFIDLLQDQSTVTNFDVDMVTKNGKIRNMMVSAHLQDNIITGTMVDLTEHRQAVLDLQQKQVELLETRERLRQILNTLPMMLFIKDAKTLRFTLMNSYGEQATRSEAKDILGRTNSELLPPEQAAVFDTVDQRVLTEQTLVDSPEVPVIIPELGTRYLHIRSLPLKSPAGEITSILGIAEDITDKKKTEQQLELFRYAVEQSPASVVITDIKGIIQYVNTKFCAVTGYASAEAIGNNPRILKSGEKPPEEYKELWETLTSGKVWSGEFHNKKKDGSLYWEYASISPIVSANGEITHYLAVKEDITDRKNAEEALLERKNELERLNRIMVDRELRMVELKQKLAELQAKSAV